MYTKFKCLPNNVGWDNVIHGGIIALICDDILGKHVLSISKPFCMTHNLNIKYLKPTYSKVEHIFKTNIISKGLTTVWIKVNIYNEKGDLCAFADAYFMILEEHHVKQENISSYNLEDLVTHLK